jgi:hypothetical protein
MIEAVYGVLLGVPLLMGVALVVLWLRLSLPALHNVAENPFGAMLQSRLETVAWSAGGSCYPRTATRAEDMLRQAVDLMGRAKVEGGNRLYVAS